MSWPRSTEPLYDRIGGGYATQRRTDDRIADRIREALGTARSVLNVGAGAGSYEPADLVVVAVEPSAVMRSQRPPGAACCIAAVAESLPFADRVFDASMAILSDHHWPDAVAGLFEMQRVSGTVVVLQWDNHEGPEFWLVRDYLPEFRSLVVRSTAPSLRARAAAIGAEITAVPVPWDCADGFFHAYWRRPEAYLDPAVRAGTSVWASVGPVATERAVAALAADLDSGEWHRRNADLVERSEMDLGARLLVAAPRRSV